MLELSLSILGSKEVEDQVISDLEELLSTAEQKNLDPIFISVGPLFLHISSVQSLIYELNIENWQEELERSTPILRDLVREKLQFLYRKAEKDDGLLEIDEVHGLHVIFDPDDYYMSLICKVEKDTVENIPIDGPTTEPYRFLKFKNEEILPKVKKIIESQ